MLYDALRLLDNKNLSLYLYLRNDLLGKLEGGSGLCSRKLSKRIFWEEQTVQAG